MANVSLESRSLLDSELAYRSIPANLALEGEANLQERKIVFLLFLLRVVQEFEKTMRRNYM